MRAFGALEDQSRRVIPAAFEHPASASELVVGKINVSLMARVIFHYVQFARELLRPRCGKTKRMNESSVKTRNQQSEGKTPISQSKSFLIVSRNSKITLQFPRNPPKN